ncbi:hypothetical protein PG985_006839 [Apiospora marii]|uniref:Uncharacterized protein n=1 Tax=Apiospora marii TaxID=335849 RepID=A0ABR1SFS6_9PEZI
MAKSLPPSTTAHSRDTTTRRPPMASSSASSRKRLQVRPPPRLKEPPWQPCRKCGKSYVQLPMELCNECDKKLYCTAPPQQKIRLDGKRPSLEAEPLVFPPVSPAVAPASVTTTTPLLQKLNRNSTKLEKRGKKETRSLLPSIESVVGTPPVVAKQACLKTAGTSNGQRHFSDSAVGQFKVNEAGEGVGDVPRPQTLSSPRPSIRRKPVATHIKEDGEPIYELPAEVTLAPAPAERGRSTETRDTRPLQVLQQAQQRQRRLSSAPPAPVPAPAESSPPRSTPPAPPSPPSPGPPPPQTYLLAQPTRDPQASFAQRVVRDAGGPLNAERQRMLTQELGRARAELECSRRAVRNLNEEMARMSVRQYRADELRRLKEDNRRLQAQISSASATARVGVEVLEAQRRRRLGIGADRPPNSQHNNQHQHHQHQHQHQQKRPDVQLGTLLQKGEKNPESLTRVYGQLCGPCRGAVHEFIAS